MSSKINLAVLVTHHDDIVGDVITETSLSYVPADPYAVSMTFEQADGSMVTWTFARQLLKDGIRRRVGWGDVEVAPSNTGNDMILFVLSSPTGRAVFSIKREDISHFLRQTHKAVPIGGEEDIVLHALDLYLEEIYS